MKKKYFTGLFIIIMLIPFVQTEGQSDDTTRDKYTLLTMPYNKRPLTLYKGQLQVNAGYKFAVRSRSFDDNGNVINLKDNGNPSVLHDFFLELKYGVLDFVEVGTNVFYMKRGVRSESVTYMSLLEDVTLNELNEYKGMGDLFLYSSVRLPFEYKFYDLKLTGGIFLPTAAFKPDVPSDIYTDNGKNALNAELITIGYHYNNRNGSGVPVYQLSGTAKASYSKFSLEANFLFRDPVKEGTNIRWSQALDDQNNFIYTSSEYKCLLDRMIKIDAALHFQAAGWFDVYLNGSYMTTSKGWTEYLGSKYKNPDTRIITLEPGYEIQISPSWTLYQSAGVTLSGKNTDAPFYLITTLSFNIFPFMK